ncbi:MAG TPA: phosphotransferase [Mycobacteriales bacterium]|nr:phosphotransferase [Mycobacteriales bacterium]
MTPGGDERVAWLRELVPLLWPAPATATLGRARHAGARRSYLILPSLEHPRLLVPRRTRRAAGGAVRGYGEQSSAARRAAVRLAAAALTAGAGDRLLRDRLEVGGAGDTIEDHLSRELGRPVLVSLHLGPARANRKPVLQLLGADGGTLGYAKVATTVLTGRLVAGEAAALRTLAGAGLTRVTVPKVLSGGSWRGLEILVQSPLPVRQPRRPADGRLVAATAEVAAVGGISTQPLDGPYGTGLRARVAALPPGADRDRLAAALDALAGADLRIGSWHGDWTPWNTAVVEGTVLAWDWERFGAGVPVGFDPLHYDLQPRLPADAGAAGMMLADSVRRAPGVLGPVGVPAESAATVAVLYLVEILTRYIGDGQTRWGDWRAMTEGVLAAARAAVPVAAR